MSKMGFNPDAAEESLRPILLPIEQKAIVNDVETVQPICYLAEITKAKEHTNVTKGTTSLKLTLAIDVVTETGVERRVYIDDFLSYQENAIFKLAGLMKELGISPKEADTDQFIGRFVYVTVKHEKYTPQDGEPELRNKINRYVGIPTEEELKALTPGDEEVSFP
jgi:hypothetical protein